MVRKWRKNSFKPDKKTKYIEVKTTGGERAPFMMTLNELMFSQKEPNYYALHRLYHFNCHTNSADFYLLNGDISTQRKLVATQYKVY
ncbi:hypothetical protein A3781_19970 [Bacillus badius]|nr:hypothetical protein A3781_19970 [Bacillus badius]